MLAKVNMFRLGRHEKTKLISNLVEENGHGLRHTKKEKKKDRTSIVRYREHW